MRRAVPYLLPLIIACGHSGPRASNPAENGTAELAAELEPARESEAESRAILFRVRPSQGGPISYLLGTIHLGVSAEELPPAVWRALQRSESFVFEAEMPIDFGGVPEDTRLAEILTSEQRERLETLLGANRAQTLADGSTTAAVATVLAELFPEGESMDQRLARAADSYGLERRALEDWRFQLELARTTFDAGELISLLEPDGREVRDLHRLVEAYRRGDLETIERIALAPKDIRRQPARFSALFFERNHAWAKTLAPMLAQRRHFIAVGAGHLPGRKGLLALLSDYGFEVERVRAD